MLLATATGAGAVALSAVLLASPILEPVAEAPAGEETLRFQDIANGVWGMDIEGVTCAENPHTIQFSEDGRKMSLRYAKGNDGAAPSEFSYEVLSEGPGFARMTLVGEERTTAEGQQVVWDLVLLTANQYCWHRTDWQPDGCTKPATRCQEDQTIADEQEDS